MTASPMGENTGSEPREKTRKSPRFVRWAVMLGIIVALNTFFVVGRALILPEPQYNTYCTEQAVPEPSSISDQTESDNYFQKCQAAYDAADQKYQLYAFVSEVVLGIVAIIIGVLPLGSSIVSSGLSYGGVVALVIAAIQYWGDAGNFIKLGVSVVALAALIYIGLKKFRD